MAENEAQNSAVGEDSDTLSTRLSDQRKRASRKRKSDWTSLNDKIDAQETRFASFEEKIDKLMVFMGGQPETHERPPASGRGIQGRGVSPEPHERPPTPGRGIFQEDTLGVPRLCIRRDRKEDMDILSTRLSPNERRTANFSISDTVSHTRHSASKSKSEVSSGNHSDNEEVGRFEKYTSKVETKNNLCEIFGSDAQTTKDISDDGLMLDDSQKQILANSWHNPNPMKMSSYRDSYKTAFPVHENTRDLLQVPTLDDTIESLLVKKYGHKAAFGNSHSLYNRQMRAVEKIGYQGQTAARMGIITTCYSQQALGSLLDNLQSPEPNLDRAIQTFRDVFAMTTKTLDQIGKAGAYHQMTRRKAAIFDTGLDDYKDYSSTIMSLPLTAEGVFGSQFDES